METLFSFMEEHSFALLVSNHGGDPFASHLPLLLDRSAGPRGTLLGHMARANPQWEQADRRPVLAVFSGPHAYVSPTWYEVEGTVPTWNYAAGTLRVIKDEAETLRVVGATVERYEEAMPQPWRFDPDAESARKLMKAVVAFRIEIDGLEGKWKLGQNHPEERRRKVISALQSCRDPKAVATADLMKRTLADHEIASRKDQRTAADVQITEMTAAEYDEVLALWQSTEGVGLNESDARESVSAYLLRNPGLSLVARYDDRIIGAVLCGHDGRRGYLHHLTVAEPFRRWGIGTRLVETCLSRLGAAGILKCNIFLFADNDAGERFWEGNGWTERPELKVLSKATPGTGGYEHRPDASREPS